MESHWDMWIVKNKSKKTLITSTLMNEVHLPEETNLTKIPLKADKFVVLISPDLLFLESS